MNRVSDGPPKLILLGWVMFFENKLTSSSRSRHVYASVISRPVRRASPLVPRPCLGFFNFPAHFSGTPGKTGGRGSPKYPTSYLGPLRRCVMHYPAAT